MLFLAGGPTSSTSSTKGFARRTLAQVGFSQVYLFVLVVVDSRDQNTGISYDGATSELQGIIRKTISTKDLVQRVGLMYYELVQPMDHPPLSVGTYGGHLERIAETAEQPHPFTQWVAQVVAQHPAQPWHAPDRRNKRGGG